MYIASIELHREIINLNVGLKPSFIFSIFVFCEIDDSQPYTTCGCFPDPDSLQNFLLGSWSGCEKKTLRMS